MTLRKKITDNKLTLNNCVKGDVVTLDKINDTIFSSKILGDGYGVIPQDTKIFSPCNCVVKDISSNGLVLTLRSENGLHIIIHFGINLPKEDTSFINLDIKVGDELGVGDRIGEYNISHIKSMGLDTSICVIVSNSDDLENMNVCTGEKSVDSVTLEFNM